MPRSEPAETVLILEDDPGVARLQRLRLERAGFAVEAVTTPDDALARIRREGIDLLVLDNQLATAEDGLTFHARLKASGYDLPVILVTGYSDDATIVRALRAGVRDYVFKSVEYLDYLPEAARRVLDQERTKAELVASRQRLQALFEGAQDAILVADDRGRYVDANPAASELTGYMLDDLRRLSILDLIPPAGQADRISQWQALIRDGRQRGEYLVARKDGSTVPVEYRSVANFQPGLHLSVLRDSTDRKRAEAELRETARERERALRDLQEKTDELRSTTQQLWQAARLAGVGELAASIAHELNNPLATVHLRLEGVLARTPTDDPRRRPLEIVEQELERMARLVANLLHFSRAGRDQVSTVNLPEEVQKTIELTEPHLRRLGVQVTPEFQPDVPDIFADRQQLRQVLLNLFTNAGDAMPAGGGLTPRVRVGELPPARPAVVIEVADTGTGIRPEHLARVTDPFFTTKEEGKGTGLGLAICRRIVHEHNGRLEIESEVGKGTTVRVTLPVRSGGNVTGLHGA
jgi:two-component system, LuxR family, sensor kinase FixL